MRSIEARLAKLETGNRGAATVVWCDDPADVETTVSAMIAEGQISVADRERLLLVNWECRQPLCTAPPRSRNGS